MLAFRFIINYNQPTKEYAMAISRINSTNRVFFDNVSSEVKAKQNEFEKYAFKKRLHRVTIKRAPEKQSLPMHDVYVIATSKMGKNNYPLTSVEAVMVNRGEPIAEVVNVIKSGICNATERAKEKIRKEECNSFTKYWWAKLKSIFCGK